MCKQPIYFLLVKEDEIALKYKNGSQKMPPK